LGVKDPTISVTARQQPNQVIITLEDNGRGIDTVRASESLVTPTEVNTHVGLHNVYHRLMYCFGPDVKIEFSSIPYYKNEVTLILPCGDSGSDSAKSSES
jgi:sensor histidine kinase YesM